MPFLTCIAAAAAVAGSATPYPRSANPTTKLFVYSSAGLDSSDLVTLETLGGGLARDAPALYRVPNGVNDTSSYSLWLREMESQYGVVVDTTFLARPATDLVGSFRAKITGYVVYSLADSSDNAALTYIAGQPAHELLVAVAKPATQALLVKWGVPQAFDATGKTSLDTYKLRGAAAFSGKLISFQLTTQYSNLAEYAVFARGPTIEYACTGEPNATAETACFKANGFKGGAAAELAVNDMSASTGVKVAMGWGPESAYVAQLGENGIYVHASDDAHDVAPVANMATHANCHSVPLAHPAPTVSDRPALDAIPAAAAVGKHKVAFLMSDGDNLQWMYNNFATDPTHWWGSPDRSKVPVGWTLSPALVELGPVILNYIARTKSANDDFVGAPSGLGYIYPSTWAPDKLAEFSALTAQFLTATAAKTKTPYSTVNVIGDPCVGGTYSPGCKGLNTPNMSSLAPLLAQDEVDGVFWYTFGAGYSGWSGTLWGGAAGKKKPVIGGRFSLWGEGKKGSMLGVKPMIENMKLLMLEGKISRSTTAADGYSLIPVHAWSHNVTDVVEIAAALEATGHFEVVTPTALLKAVARHVVPPTDDTATIDPTRHMETPTLIGVAGAGASRAVPQTELKVFVLAGQSNMEGQAEVNKTCSSVEPGKCSAVGAIMNGTLAYQLTDPRTEKLFSQCWDKANNNWTVLPDVKIWFNEKGKAPPTEKCPLGCPAALSGGTFGDMSIGFGCGGHADLGDRQHIGPEYGFGFALNTALKEKVLIIKTAWGGKTLCGDFRPPSSANGNMSTGFYYTQMLKYVSEITAPANMSKLFPDLTGTPKIVGFGWDQGWNDGCGVECTEEYEVNMVNLISDLRKEWANPDMAISIPVSGFDGWAQTNPRRLGIINAQFGACNATRHPGQHNCVSEETRNYWRQFANSPVNQGYHWWHNAESYFLVGQTMGAGMLKAMAGEVSAPVDRA